MALLCVRRRLRPLLWRRDGGLSGGVGIGGVLEPLQANPTIIFPIINRHLFGVNAPLGSIYSFQMVGAGTGMALGGWLGGMLFDATGTYTAAIIVAAVIGYLGVPLALSLPRHHRGGGTLIRVPVPA